MALILFILASLTLLCNVLATTYCPYIESPENGLLRNYGHYYIAYCNDGYYPVGNTYVACNNGQWDSPLLTCSKDIVAVCPNLSAPDHGSIKCDEGPLSIGRTCFFECSAGYTLFGSYGKRCMHDLKWSGGIPKCVPKSVADTSNVRQCTSLPTPENAIKKCSQRPLAVGKSCSFRCQSGYRLEGAELRTCMQNLNWSGTQPRCISDIDPTIPCEVPAELPNGRISCTRQERLIPGEVCRFECNDGYVLRGLSTFECWSNGKLTDYNGKEEIPECVVKEPERVRISAYRPPGPFVDPCTRNKGGCEHTCTYVGGQVRCECPEGYFLIQGRRCVDTLPTCPDLPPPEHGSVKCEAGPLTVGKYCRFECSRGYSLSGVYGKMCMSDLKWTRGSTECRPKEVRVPNSQLQCMSLPAPENGIIACDAAPLTEGKGCRFNCNPGYRIEGVKYRRCMSTWKWSGASPKCISETATPCETPPELTNGRIANCSPEKIPVAGQTCFFRCNFGYVLKGPDQMHCRTNGKLSDINGNEEFPVCVEASREQSPHRGGGSNRRPYTTRSNTAKPCSEGNGGCDHICRKYRGQELCYCRKGYTLDTDRKHCKDINECYSEHLNKCNNICNNTEGGYVCSCYPGYVKIDEYKCEGCRKNSYLSQNENACVDCPENSHTDYEARTSIDECICNPGFTGDPKQNIPCEDIDECASGNFGCSHTCVNLPGSAYCSCDVGYTTDKDNKTCIDIDECSVKNGGCHGTCVNTDGDFHCLCSEGYGVSNKDRYSCDDIDECLNNNGGCEQKCVNYPGGYYCSCESGFRLDVQQKNCTSIVCPTVPLPNYSKMTCKQSRNKLPESDSYPVGTVCQFTCFKGYKSTSESNNIQCLQNKDWNGTIPECIAQNCKPLGNIENGNIHPSSCAAHGISVKQKCTFTCNPGYTLKGLPVFTCNNDLNWAVENKPTCEKIKIQPFLSCARDITVTLLPGENTYNITIPEPTTNLDSYSITPNWVSTEKPVAFPAGITKVTFSSANPNTNGTKKCSLMVHVIDKEPPIFFFCPDPIHIEGASGFGVPVSWEEPLVTDNVEVVSMISSMEPNSTLTPGTYTVEYIAKDDDGNIASCSFDINITRSHCADLVDPVHGEANCMDWISGKLCNPTCEDGYVRNPNDPTLYSCDDAGLWDPVDLITPCLKYVLPVSSLCPQGYELITTNEEEFCMECPENTVWSSSSKTCET